MPPKPRDLRHLRPWGEGADPDHDKRLVTALREKINARLTADPATVKKAALILERWLNPRQK